MPKERRSFSEEYKLEAVRRVEKHEHSVSHIARELGEIRALLMAMPTVHRTADDLRHFRCEACGTISHGLVPPARCARCGKPKFINVDIEG